MQTIVLDSILNLYIGAVLFLTTAYAYYKTTVVPINKIYRSKLTVALGCLIISVVFAVLYPLNLTAAQLTAYLYPPVFFSIFEKQQRRRAFLLCFILSTFTRILLLIPSALVSTVMVIINYHDRLFLSMFIAYALTFLSAFLLLKVKRFKNGFQFFQDENNLGLGLVIAGVFFAIIGSVYVYEHTSVSGVFFGIVITGLFISGFGLYIWIRRSITAHYRERLQMKSEEHHRKLLKEKDDEIEKLNQSNELLAKIVHRDNHLMNALGSAVDAYFESGDSQFREDLLREIQTLAKERSELIEKAQRDSKLLPSTGNILIDSAVSNLYIKAAARGIDFSLTVSETVDKIIGKYISQTDLQTLICDHIKDAVIAVESAGINNGKILVELSAKNNNYSITIFDNGAAFEIETLAKLGRERVTTHPDSGGSGIGFMTTFETLRKAHACLVITEFENKIPFSKSISFVFNGENKFIIQSYRSELLKSAINRDDIIIL